MGGWVGAWLAGGGWEEEERVRGELVVGWRWVCPQQNLHRPTPHHHRQIYPIRPHPTIAPTDSLSQPTHPLASPTHTHT